MELDQIILAARAALHFATFCILFSYNDPDAERRPFVSLLAVMLAAPSIGMSLYIVGNWGARSLTASQMIESVLMTVFAAALLIAVALCRGNVARLLPRRAWSHHP